MSIKGRIQKLEEKWRNGPDPLCEECTSVIIYEEIAEDGTVTYPSGEPCPVCDSRASGGRIGRIVVDARAPEDRPEKRGFTLELGDVYQIEYPSE